MEIFLIFVVILIVFYLSKNTKQETTSNNSIKNYQKNHTKEKKSLVKNSSYKYNPGQVRKKSKISPESKLDPITWDAYVVCNVCGSEKKVNQGEIICCR